MDFKVTKPWMVFFKYFQLSIVSKCLSAGNLGKTRKRGKFVERPQAIAQWWLIVYNSALLNFLWGGWIGFRIDGFGLKKRTDCGFVL